NRDYAKLESPEVRALVALLVHWDPVLVVDMHTTNGSYHREPVTYTTGGNPNQPKALAEYMWGRLFPAVAGSMRARDGWETVPYGSFADAGHPEKGWENDSIEARYGTNYVALRNRLTILDENYSYADFKTRVLSSLDFITAVLEYSDAHAGEIVALVRRADAETRESFAGQSVATGWRLDRLDDVTIRGFEHVRTPVTAAERAKYPWLGEYRMTPTAVQRDYTVPYLALAVPTLTVALPAAGYVVLPGQNDAVANLRAHGIALERLDQPCTVKAERFVVGKVATAKSIYQGHVLVTVSGEWVPAEVELPAGAVIVDLHQPLARVIAVLLEPSSTDSLATWGFFNRPLVRQWSSEPGDYPVLRLAARPAGPTTIMPAE
ncbi:MAG: M14 family metallopeptidase, partial [Acidobacteria bacterium]|nr:M14 family metallopeptidase [Acidobacteriota bacterium]